MIMTRQEALDTLKILIDSEAEGMYMPNGLYITKDDCHDTIETYQAKSTLTKRS